MKKHIRLNFLVLLLLLTSRTVAQDAFIPLNRDFYHVYDRLDILSNDSIAWFSAQKPYRRARAAELVKFHTGSAIPRPIEPRSVRRVRNASEMGIDNWEHLDVQYGRQPKNRKSAGFFQREEAFYSVKEDRFFLSTGPVLGFGKSFDSDDELNLYQNTRGIQMRGAVGNRVGFYSYISENQFRYPSFYRNQIDSTGFIPGVGFYKRFKNTGHDFFSARGYITFSPIEEINVQFGQDQNFIGDGYRSLIWSDNAKENLFLKLQTQVWKIKYMNLFSELTNAEDVIGNGQGLSRKYSALHHLTVALKPNLHIGFFEQVIFDRSDSVSQGGYDINYLNPIIFYRAVEHGLNSADNVILGMNWKWNFLGQFSFYGQYVLDEFKKDELFNRTGWWANKWAFQGGLKYIDVLFPGLDLQYEFNTVRPYMYTHFKSSQNFTNYSQSMAHPLGANFKEHAVIARYQIQNKWRFQAKFIVSNQGQDSASNSFFTYGGDVTKDYLSRPKETGIAIGDGVSNEIQSLELRATYQYWHNLNVDLVYFQRKQINGIRGEQKSSFVTLALRYNLPYKSYN